MNPKHWALSFVRILIVDKMQKKHSLGTKRSTKPVRRLETSPIVKGKRKREKGKTPPAEPDQGSVINRSKGVT